MSILINMEMPKNCAECPCRMIGYTADHCNVLRKFIDCVVGSEGRREDCPLVEVPPHGRLIDADELEKKFCSHCDDYMSGKDECKEGCFDLKIIKSMPTVIPADKEGER